MVNRRRPVLAAILLLGTGMVLAAPGNLDPQFGDGGLVRLRIGDLGADAFAVLQQSDGKLVLVGTGNADGGSSHDFLAVRLNGNGDPDPDFSSDGIATADRAGGTDYALAAVQQPDGKLALAGFAYAANQGNDIAVARFDEHGTLDSTFGDGGWATLDLGGDHEAATGLILQSNGSLVISGFSDASGVYRTVFARFNSDGLLDPTFGTGGTTWIDFGDGSENWANDLAEQPDGKLVTGGGVYGPGLRFDMSIVRVTGNGIPDDNFDGDGMLFVDFDDLGEQAQAVAIQPDGAIVAAGYTVPVSDGYFKLALLRVSAEGSLDGTFGAGGKSVTDLGTQAELNSIVVQPDGKLAAAGSLLTPYFYPDTILARFEADGTLDASFGSEGIALADFGEEANGPWSIGLDLIQQSDGKHLVSASVPGNFVAAVRFDENASYPGRIGLTNTFESVDEETATEVTFTVRRSGGKSGHVSVEYETVAGSAEPGSDFVAASGTLDWNDGDATDRSITIDLINDDVPETPEDFSLVLAPPAGGARLAAGSATTDIRSMDGPGVLSVVWPWWELGDETAVGEGIGTISLYVSRQYGSQGEISVRYGFGRSSAEAGADFANFSGSLTWADGDTSSRAIEIEVIDDEMDEPVERLEVQILDPTGGATLGTSRQSFFIYDNDPSPPAPPPPSPPPPGRDGGGGGGTTGVVELLLGLGALLARRRRSRSPQTESPGAL